MTQRILNAQAMTEGEAVLEPVEGASAVGGELWCQTHGGVTLYELAAYAALRSRFHEASCVDVGSVEVAPHLGNPALTTAIRSPGLTLLLDGATWGYTGTGPRGLAAILQDLGAFEAHDSALRWVAGLPMDEPWHLEVRPSARRNPTEVDRFEGRHR